MPVWQQGSFSLWIECALQGQSMEITASVCGGLCHQYKVVVRFCHY